MDIATLGLEFESEEARKATKDLKAFKAEAKKTSASNDNLKKSTDKVSKSQEKMARTSSKGKKALVGMSGALGVVTRMAGAAGLALGTLFSAKTAFPFIDAMAEVSTLVNTATFNMNKLTAAALKQSAAYGGGAVQQTKAFYNIISAGAGNAAKATEILNAANKLAVGGVTSVAVASDGLTSVLNAYGDKVENAAAVSDALFVGMKAGKTTIGQLSAGLGKVAPLAATLGVDFDSLVASISALTKGGISTSESITGVRAILAAITKPTNEATKLAKRLGIEFNSAGLKAKGFTGFMEELKAKTGGNADALAVLFGGVEAIVPAMALAGQAGKDYAAIMEEMAIKAGATQEAFEKIANTPGFQSKRIWSALEAEVLKLTVTLAQALVPALRFVADNMENIFKIVKIFGVTLLAAFSPALITGVWALVTAIGTGLVGAFHALTAAILANPLGALVVAFVAVVTAAYQFRDSLASIIGVDIFAIAKKGANNIIALFVGAYTGIKATWSLLPMAIGDVMVQVNNKIISGLNFVIQKSIAGISKFKEFFGGEKIDAGNLTIGLQENPFEGAGAKVGGAIAKGIKDALGTDFIGKTVQSVKNQFTPTVTPPAATKPLGIDLGGGSTGKASKIKGAKQDVDELKKSLEDAKGVANSFFSDLRSGLENGEGFWKSFKNAGLNALSSIADMAQKSLINSIFGNIFGAVGGGSGGGLLGLPVFGFAKGGISSPKGPIDLPKYANGGVAKSASIFAEAGTEAAVPLPDGRRIPVDLRTPAGSNDNSPRVTEQHFSINAQGADPAALERLRKEIVQLRTDVPKISASSQKRFQNRRTF